MPNYSHGTKLTLASIEEPPYLTVGTDVSAKYKGAFCEAKITDVNKHVKLRVLFDGGTGTHLIDDTDLKTGSTIETGTRIEAKHPEKKQQAYAQATITKILDHSRYTVVFDDGDQCVLRRNSLCLKSGKHFAESETLDQLPLTNPEHFGNPVKVGAAEQTNNSSSTPATNIKSLANNYSQADQKPRGKSSSSSASDDSKSNAVASSEVSTSRKRQLQNHDNGVEVGVKKLKKERNVAQQLNNSSTSVTTAAATTSTLGKRGATKGRRRRESINNGSKQADQDDASVGDSIDSTDNNVSESSIKFETIEVGVKLMVQYGKGKAQNVYEAKVNKIETNSLGRTRYFVHYTGWNNRYDEWITKSRILSIVTEKENGAKDGRKQPEVVSNSSPNEPASSPAQVANGLNSTSTTNTTGSSSNQKEREEKEEKEKKEKEKKEKEEKEKEEKEKKEKEKKEKEKKEKEEKEKKEKEKREEEEKEKKEKEEKEKEKEKKEKKEKEEKEKKEKEKKEKEKKEKKEKEKEKESIIRTRRSRYTDPAAIGSTNTNDGSCSSSTSSSSSSSGSNGVNCSSATSTETTAVSSATVSSSPGLNSSVTNSAVVSPKAATPPPKSKSATSSNQIDAATTSSTLSTSTTSPSRSNSSITTKEKQKEVPSKTSSSSSSSCCSSTSTGSGSSASSTSSTVPILVVSQTNKPSPVATPTTTYELTQSVSTESSSTLDTSASTTTILSYQSSTPSTSHKESTKNLKFCDEIDESDCDKKISILQERIMALRQAYISLKTELADLDRKKKRPRTERSNTEQLNSCGLTCRN